MPNNIDPKNYPTSSEEISKLLGLEADSDPTDTTQYAPATAAMPSNLPVLEGQLAPDISEPAEEDVNMLQKPLTETEEYELQNEAEFAAEAKEIAGDTKFRPVLQGFKKAAPYLAVFGVGLFLYYFYFTDFSFRSLLSNSVKVEVGTERNKALDQLVDENRNQFETWMRQFYFDISDNSVLDPYADNSGNGLTNFQKFLLNLNPKEYDTLNSGKPDGQSVIDGIDPATGKKFSDSKKKIIEKYFDLEAISNKLAAKAVNFSNQEFSDYSESNNVLGINTAQASQNLLNVNTDNAALLEIPSLKITAPLIWTKDTKNFDADLKNGVVHYPGTTLPGNIGTSYISGHSSNYIWSKSKYNEVFVKLDQLKDGEVFTITLTNSDGKKVKLHYVVKSRGQYLPNDQAQFQNRSTSTVALSTCWPPGTTAKRLVVFSDLTQTENLN